MGKYLTRPAAYHGLLAWYQAHRRVLPWREEPSLYRVWISEIMLQQTQVATVGPYFERFMARFGSVEILAQADLDEVLSAWAGLGYYSRARNLHQAARQIVEQGGFPRNREGWLELPGVGPYTAGAIVSIALNQPEAILDGNVERVLSRLHRVDRANGDAAFKSRLWELARFSVERAQQLGIPPSDFNQALMELGATLCQFRNPRCGSCPLRADCGALSDGNPEAYPPAKPKKQWIQVREQAHCLIDESGRVLLRKRQKGEWHAGLWDLPLQEQLAVSSSSVMESFEVKYIVTRHKILRTVNVGRPDSRPIQGLSPEQWSWEPVHSPGVAAGSPLRKSLSRVLQILPS